MLSRCTLGINDTKCYSISRHKPLKPVDNFGDWLLATTKNGVQTLAKNFPILFCVLRYAVQGCLLRRKQLLNMIKIDAN